MLVCVWVYDMVPITLDHFSFSYFNLLASPSEAIPAPTQALEPGHVEPAAAAAAAAAAGNNHRRLKGVKGRETQKEYRCKQPPLNGKRGVTTSLSERGTKKALAAIKPLT